MTNDDIKQQLVQKYEEMVRAAIYWRTPIGKEDFNAALLVQCKRQAEYLGLDKETEYLMLAIHALERSQSIAEMLLQQYSIHPAPFIIKSPLA